MVTCDSCTGNGFTDHRQRNRKTGKQNETIRRYAMKFLIAVLAVHTIVEMISNRITERRKRNIK